MSLRFRIGFSLVASVIAFTSHASADTRPKPAAQTAAADAVAEHTRRGDIARLSGRCEDAITAYNEALEAAERTGLPPEKRAPILGDLGVCEVALAKYRDGAEHLYRSMRYADTLTAVQRSRFGEAQKKAKPHVVAAFIEVSPPDARVTFDGKPLAPRGPSYVVFTTPGPHTVRASLEGHEDHVTTFSSPAGGWPSVHVTPRKVQAPSAPRVVQVQSPTPPREDVAPKLRAAGFVAAGVGLAAGIGFTIAGQVAHDRLKERRAELMSVLPGADDCNSNRFYRQECSELIVMQNARDSLDMAARGAFIAGGLLGAVALTSLWWAPADKRPAPIQVGVLATPRAGSAQVRWRW